MKKSFSVKLLVLLFFAFNFQLSTFNYSHAAREVERIVAKVNNDIIFRSELDEGLRNARSQMSDKATIKDDELSRTILGQMIEERLLLQQAKTEEIDVNEEDIKSAVQTLTDKFPTKDEFNREMNRQGLTLSELKDNLRKQLKILRLIEKNVKRKIQVSSKEIKEYYGLHKDELDKSEKDAKEEIASTIFDQKFNEAFSKWMARLKKNSVIEIKL